MTIAYMTQDEKWDANCKEVMSFLKTNQKNPSKHRVEEHLMLNFVKYNRKLMNAGKMKTERIEMFHELLSLMDRYKRINQYQ